MRYAHRTVGFVDMLPPCARSPISIHPDIFFINLNCNTLISHRINPDTGKTSMPSRIRIKRRYAYQTVHSTFSFSPAICILTANLECYRLNSRFLSKNLMNYLNLKIMALRPTHIHTHQHRRPVIALYPPGTRINFQKAVITVSLSRK